MSTDGHERYYLIHETLLPEAALKTIQVKNMLTRGEVHTVNEAVERVGMSRSAFYKYKDGIYAFDKMEREHIVTISLNLQHRSGMLSQVLTLLAAHAGNVLTINQTIPLQGVANVVISLETSAMQSSMEALLAALSELSGVKRAQIIGQGSHNGQL